MRCIRPEEAAVLNAASLGPAGELKRYPNNIKCVTAINYQNSLKLIQAIPISCNLIKSIGKMTLGFIWLSVQIAVNIGRLTSGISIKLV